MGIRFRSNKLVTVSIEHGVIKLMVTQGMKVLEHRVLLANPRFFHESLVSNKSRVAGIIKNAVSEGGHEKLEAIGAVPGFQTALRVLTLPVVPGMDPEAIIPREAARTMGVSVERSQLAWHHIEKQAGQSRWLVASAARRAVSSLTETATEAGLNMKVVDLRPFALARAVNQREAVIAWVATDGCDVVIVRGATPVEYQSLFWGAEPVEGAVLVSRLADVLDRFVTTHDRNSAEGPLSEETAVYVCGSAVAREPEVGQQIADSLQRSLGELSVPLTVPADFPTHDLIVNVGLALREV